MIKLNVLGIDLAKNKFQVCKRTPDGRVIYNKAVSRSQLKTLLLKERKALVAMESCAGTHYWARYAKEQGHQVKAMSARKVKPFRQGHKTDENDAEAIAIAAAQPQVKACRLLSVADQCQQGIVRMRDMLKKQKTASAKQLRDLLLELGYPIAKGDASLMKAIPEVLEDAENQLTGVFRAVLHEQWEHLKGLLERITEVDQYLAREIRSDVQCKRLQDLEGVGPVNAIGLKIALSDPEHFKSSREASACLGATPIQHSTGGQEKIGSISKISAHKTLRCTMYEGSMAVIRQLDKREAVTVKEQWLKQLVARRGKKVAAIALVNKNIRTAYALLKNDTDYNAVMLAA